MDPVARAFYEMMFELAFLRKRGDEFQNFFADIMEKVHSTDFMRVRPWGNVGDRKNDGYLKSERTLFQVYAPNEMSAANSIAKIDEDFFGALPFWKEYFDTWVFVHNSESGLGPDVTKKLLELDNVHGPAVKHWGQEELRRKIFELSATDLVPLLGYAPTRRDILDLGLEVLAPVLEQLALLPASITPDLRPPPADKIEQNMLSQHVEVLLKNGMARADLVETFFSRQPAKQDEIATSFRSHYEWLRNKGMAPDMIFSELQRYACGELVPTPAKQGAVLAVLAFYFEKCDIFERAGKRSV